LVFFVKICIWMALFYLGHFLLKKELKLPRVKVEFILGILTIVYALIYLFWNLSRHGSFNTFAFDLSVYLQALSNWQLYSSILEKSLLTDHFSPLLFLLIPIVKYLSSPLTLFILQAIVLAAAAIPLYYLSRRLGTEEWPALLIAFIYLNFFYTRQMAFADFHIENFMPLAFLILINLFLSGRGWRYWLMLVVCLTIKEDVGFYLCFWAMLTAIFKPEHRTAALVTAGIAFFSGILALIVLLPGNQGVYPYFSYWSQFGKGLFGIVAGALQHPFTAIAVFLKPEFIKMMFALAFLPFFTYWGIILLVPVWVQLASNHAPQASLQLYYAAPILPFVFIALAAGWAKMQNRFIQAPNRRRILWGTALFLLVFNFTWISPLAISKEHHTVKSILRKIPPQGQVLAQANIAPHISRQARVRVLGMNSFKTLPHFVVFHVKSNIWPFSRENYLRALDQIRLDSRYKIWKEEAGLLIFLKRPKK